MKLTYDDWCRLSVLFNRVANLADTRDQRINEFLKQQITKAKFFEDNLSGTGGGNR